MAKITQEMVTAIRSCNLEALTRLLEEGADPGARDDKGWTVLHHLAWLPSQQQHNLVVPSMLMALLRHGADLEACDAKGATALQSACAWGHLPVAEMLFACGASTEGIDFADKLLSAGIRQRTEPVQVALGIGNPDFLVFVLERDKDPATLPERVREGLELAARAISRATEHERAQMVEILRSWQARLAAHAALGEVAAPRA